ncbi:MAG TPA: enoyl-CoA hydratase/isomerase family protein [Xanthobacteraceae bacterium]|nr:enoyl-CoA hydratase/isomerase family protein [Xanthobacteraceae bacterium]
MFEVAHDGGIAIVTLRRGKANALDVDFCKALKKEFRRLAKSDAKAVVLTSEGKIFSAGVDLPRAAAGGQKYLHALVVALDDMYEEIFLFPKPLVAAINGHAIAGGCVLACCADYRVLAADAGRMGVTELQVGVPFPPFAFEVLRATTSPMHFPKFTASGETFDTQGALANGFADEAVSADRLLPRAIEKARELAAIRAVAFRVNKLHTRATAKQILAKDRGRLAKQIMKVWEAKETADNIRAYVARTFGKS